MSFEEIRLDKHEGIALLTLHRPDRMNAFTTEMMLEIVAALDECDADDAVRAVIFTGSGDRAYCAGADLGQGAATFDYDKRTDKAATCSTCQLYTGKAGAADGPCAVFPGKSVAAKGWCSSWVKKA